MKKLAVIFLLLCVGTLSAVDLTVPVQVTGQPGSFIQIPAKTSGTLVKWYVVDQGVNLFPTDLLKDTKTAVVVAPTAGSFRILAYTSDATGPSDPAVCTVVVGTPPPPTPPTPPAPTDAFTQSVQDAYAKETDPNKAKQAAWLASVYQGAPSLLTPGITAGTLLTQLSNAIHNPTLGIPKGSLPLVSKVLGDDMNAVLGTNSTAVVDPAVAKMVFAKYAVALGTLK